jgi:hypothetical protein
MGSVSSIEGGCARIRLKMERPCPFGILSVLHFHKVLPLFRKTAKLFLFENCKIKYWKSDARRCSTRAV